MLLLGGLLLGTTSYQALLPAAASAMAPPPPPAAPVAARLPAPTAQQLTVALQADATREGTRFLSVKAMREFYHHRHDAPAWQGNGQAANAGQLLAVLRDTAAEGLTPADYHLRELETLSKAPDNDPAPEKAVERELLLTDAFLTVAAHYRYGHLNLQSVLPDWQPQRRDDDLGALLETALTHGTVRDSLQQLLPSAPEYLALKAAYHRYQFMADQGGWPAIPSGSRMQQGDHGERVALLRQRLAASDDLAAEARTASDRFDASLQAAVQRFQARHGLKVDGVVDRETLAALNVPATERLRQLATNLERWRWLPRDLGSRHIEVNIPGFSLTVMENQQPVLTMKVIAGRPDRPTPILNSVITHLVLNPTWEVPHDIATKDLLPKIRKNPAFLQRFGFRVLAGNGGDGQEVSPAQINWQKVTPATFHYHLSQNPGPKNFLGQVKFIFANAYSVYLHDTPSKNLFQKESRPFSSGCVRAEKPLELAALLLHDTPLGSEPALDAALADTTTRTVHLPRPIPIYLLYWTAWVDDQGVAQFRPDLYGHDRLIEEGLRGRAIKKPLPCIGECGQ